MVDHTPSRALFFPQVCGEPLQSSPSKIFSEVETLKVFVVPRRKKKKKKKKKKKEKRKEKKRKEKKRKEKKKKKGKERK